MAYQFASCQADLPSNVPAGWNDPPQMGVPRVGSENRLAQMRRRPVDPSIQGGGTSGFSSNAATPQAAGYAHGQSPVFQQPIGNGYPATPQQHHQQGYQQQPMPGGQPMGGLVSTPTHPHTNFGMPGHNASPMPTAASYGQQPMNAGPVPLHSQSAGHLPQGTAPFSMAQQQAVPHPVLPAHPNSAFSPPYSAATAPALATSTTPSVAATQYSGQHYSHAHPTSAPPVQHHQQQQNPSYHQQPVSTHPGAAGHSGVAPVQAQISSHYPVAGAAPAMPSSHTEMHRPIYDAFTVNGGSPTTAGKPVDLFSVTPQSLSEPPTRDGVRMVTAPQSNQTQAAWTAASSGGGRTQPIPHGTLTACGSILTMSTSLDSNPNSLVFAPPNAVDDARNGLPGGANYQVPVKAAGDVSLSGPQLVSFLTKASMRLPQVKCQGVQLRLNQLNELVQQNRITEGCLKKLNFVVDAIDRELYDDASLFFDQLQAQYPEEMTAWSQGLKLLILELKRPAGGRTGSAGAHVRSQ